MYVHTYIRIVDFQFQLFPLESSRTPDQVPAYRLTDALEEVQP
jgi:hypothetical protein